MKFFWKSVLLLCSFVFVLKCCYSCTTPTRHRQLTAEEKAYKERMEIKRRYGHQIENAAELMAVKVQELIAPQSGKEVRYSVFYDDLTYDRRNHRVRVYSKFSFLARDFLSGVSYGTCQIAGVLDVYLPVRSIDGTRANFFWKERNQHIIDVSKRRHWDTLDKGLSISF